MRGVSKIATTGFDRLFYATISESPNGEETYGKPKQLAKAIKADLSIDVSEAVLYADDSAQEIVKEFKSGKLALGVDDIGVAVAGDLTGATVDDNGVLISTSEDGGSPVAIGFRAKKSNGKYRHFWLYRVKFGVPSTNLQTKGDSISFQTPSIEGTIMRRNKPDARGTHPWKIEANEDDPKVSKKIITDWFSEVYEPSFQNTPDFSISFTTQPQSVTNLTEGSIQSTDKLTVEATVVGGNNPAYQWYSNTVNSNSNGTLISGATSAEFSIPDTLTEGIYYYYCVAISGSLSCTSYVAVVIVS